MGVDLEKMKKLLALDIPQAAIAQALGCTEGFISQQLSREEFSQAVATAKLTALEAEGDRASRLNSMLDATIEKLQKNIPITYKTADLLAIFKIIDSSVSRNAAAVAANNALQLANGSGGQLVQILLPNITALTFIKNTNGEIVEAGGRCLTTLSTQGLKQLAGTIETSPLGDTNGSSGGYNIAKTVGGNY